MAGLLQGNSNNTGIRYGVAEYTFVKERLKLGENPRGIFNTYKEKGYIEGSNLNPGSITYNGIARMASNISRWPWTVEEFVNNFSKKAAWSPKEAIVLKQWYKQKESRVRASEWQKLAIALNEANPTAKRTRDGIIKRIRKLGLDSKETGKSPFSPDFEFNPKILEETGLKLQDGFEVKRSAGQVLLECIEKGHKFEREYADINYRKYGCPVCAGTHRSFYNEKYFKDHPEDKLTPCYIYLASFILYGFCKPGLTEEGNEKRRFATYAHLKPEIKRLRLLTKYEVYKLECLFQEKFPNYLTFSEELKGNGSTECFDISIEAEIIKIIDEYESDII